MELVDTDRFPVDRLEQPSAAALVARCRERFADDGVVALPHFLRQAAVEAIAAEAAPLVPSAFWCSNTHTVLLGPGPPADEPVPPEERLLRTTVGSIANDHLDPDGPLQRLYDWPPLTAFIGAVLGYDELHRSADPLGALSVNVYGDGDRHGWHFDESRFTVTLSIQQAEAGGRFEYVTGLRDAGALDRQGIGRVLDGDRQHITRLPFKPGTLLIFGGRYTVHRVSPVTGPTNRLVPVLTYDTVPGATNSNAVRQLFWGRTS